MGFPLAAVCLLILVLVTLARMRAARARIAHDPRGLQGRAGFSLVEVLGLLAVFTILAIAIIPPVIQSMDRAAREREQRALRQMMEGLRCHILRTRSIPDHTTFAQAIATELGVPPSRVLTNRRRVARRYVIDPAIPAILSLPYTQGPFGVTNRIVSPLGIMLVSSTGTSLPASLASGVAPSAEAFSNLWNTAENEVPEGWSWKGRGEDLQIERLSLDCLFVPLVLEYDTAAGGCNAGRFAIDGLSTNALPSVPIFMANYLRGTLLELHHHEESPVSLQVREVLEHALAFVYEGDAWRARAYPAPEMLIETPPHVVRATPSGPGAAGSSFSRNGRSHWGTRDAVGHRSVE